MYTLFCALFYVLFFLLLEARISRGGGGWCEKTWLLALAKAWQ